MLQLAFIWEMSVEASQAVIAKIFIERGGVDLEYGRGYDRNLPPFVFKNPISSSSTAFINTGEARYLNFIEFMLERGGSTAGIIPAMVTGTDDARQSAFTGRSLLTSRIHRRKPAGKPMPQATARANAKRSSIRAAVEHVFAHQKNRFGLFIRTIGLAGAEAKLTLANIAYNFDRLVFHERRNSMG